MHRVYVSCHSSSGSELRTHSPAWLTPGHPSHPRCRTQTSRGGEQRLRECFWGEVAPSPHIASAPVGASVTSRNDPNNTVARGDLHGGAL